MTAGQRAMATAMLYPNPEKGGRGKRSEAAKAKATLGLSSMLLSEARYILVHAPDLVKAVMDGRCIYSSPKASVVVNRA